MGSNAEAELLRVAKTVSSMEVRLSKVQAELEAHRAATSAELEAAMTLAERDTGVNLGQGVAVLEQAVARETEEAASHNRGAISTTLIPPPDPIILYCQVWARFHECELQSESMHKCRPACKMASSGHLPLLDSSLEALLVLDVASSQQRVLTFAPEMGRALCQISQLVDGKNWAISRPAGSVFAPFDGTLHTLLTVVCVQYEDREQGDGPTLIRSNTRSGYPRVMNPLGRATSRGEALGSYECIAQSLAFVLGCMILLLLLGQGKRAKVLRSEQPLQSQGSQSQGSQSQGSQFRRDSYR